MVRPALAREPKSWSTLVIEKIVSRLNSLLAEMIFHFYHENSSAEALYLLQHYAMYTNVQKLRTD